MKFAKPTALAAQSIALSVALSAALSLSACAPPKDRVIFVTNTSLGIHTDQALPKFTVAYDRTEGVIGPTQPDGNMPGVYAGIQSNGLLFGRKVKQVFATGLAAESITDSNNAQAPTCPTGARCDPPVGRIGFFGTDTLVGFKIGYSVEAPDRLIPVTLHFGVKRREFSSLPLHDTNGFRTYPSTIAMLDNSGSAAAGAAKFDLVQFFAAGKPAENLAANTAFKTAIRTTAEEPALAAYDGEVSRQRMASVQVLNCYAGLDRQRELAAWQDAINKGVLNGPAVQAIAPLLADPTDDQLRRGRAEYVNAIQNTSGSNPERGDLLEEHRKTVCG